MTPAQKNLVRAMEKALDALQENPTHLAAAALEDFERQHGEVHEFERAELLLEAERRIRGASLESIVGFNDSLEELKAIYGDQPDGT